VIYNIQFARAIAAMLVVYAHIGVPGCTFGHFGVNIFFVISGYIMTMICHRNPERFFARRIVRIVPLYWLITLAVFALSFIKPDLLNSTTPSWPNFLKSIFFIPYVKENGELHPMLDVGWTLNYEMYFYAAIALALFVTPRKLATLAAGALMIVVQIICALIHTHLQNPASLAGTLTRFYSYYEILEFPLGIGLYHLATRLEKVRLQPAILLTLALACLAFMAGNQVYHYAPRIEFLTFSLPSAAFVFCLLLLEREKFVITRLTLLGDASYALYLTNEFVVEGYRKIGAKILHIPLISIPGILLVMVAAAIISILIFKLIEKPIHDGLRSAV